ncbi:MAG: hypothetical protein AB7V50_04255 [Vampirovibrionia bacterium]
MSQYLAILPFALVVVIILATLIIMDWLNNRKIGSNLQQVAFSTGGTVTKEDGNYILKGTYNERDFTIYLKPRGMGKNKALYYHIELESNCDLRLVSLKRYVKSRLEARVNEMHPIEIPDEDFNMVNKILTDDPEIGNKLVKSPVMIDVLKNIMEKYTEMRIKKDITLIKRYHVKLTEPEILLSTLNQLSRMAYEIEKASNKIPA